MSREYLPDQEKRILLSALSHEMRLVKDNNLTELIPVVENLKFKFWYDRLFKKIEVEAYEQGIEDERPKAFAKGYDSGYQKGRLDAIEELKPSADMVAYEQGRLDALDHCEKCETDQWDALYKAEMKGRADAINECLDKFKEVDSDEFAMFSLGFIEEVLRGE